MPLGAGGCADRSSAMVAPLPRSLLIIDNFGDETRPWNHADVSCATSMSTADRPAVRQGGDRVPGMSTMNSADLADRLEEEIVLGRRYPRERLVEDELMARWAAKRHAVRSALRELETRGLVERKPNAGAFVKAYTAAEVRELYAVREILEVSAARLIGFPLPDGVVEELVDVQRRH